MSAIAALASYDSDDESDTEVGQVPCRDAVAHLHPLPSGKSLSDLHKSLALNAAPDVAVKEDVQAGFHLDPSLKEVDFNPSYETMFAPELGPVNPFRTQQMAAPRNTLSGFAEPAHINDFMFEQQRRTFHTYGYALDPTVDRSEVPGGDTYIGSVEEAEKNQGLTVFESGKKKIEKRKKLKDSNPANIEGFQGPWAKFVDEKDVAKPSEEEQKELDEIIAKRQKKGKHEDDKPAEEKTVLHVKDMYDYQGRSYLHIPQDLGVNLRSSEPPEKCYLPKKQMHIWTGHTKGVSAIRLFPRSGHLLLSCSMDCKIKLWEVYNDRRCLRTFIGHSKAVRDICFNNEGTQFLSAAYDRYLKLWDTETGKCLVKFTNRKVPYCVKFNPDEDKQSLFVAGMSDKKIVQWDIRSGEVVQEYDRHLGAVNTITFVDENRRFVSTSDDKSLRVWEWDIPVDFKYIAEPSMHSMPAVTLSPNGKWLACQSMDNQILIFGAQNRFRLNKKKIFKGHMVAGYACQVDFSPDMSYVASGDADGKLNIWDWKTTKLYSRIKAHDKVCISAIWHPHETSKVITCGWDGQIKLWD
ncbi:pre-mRNA-processing factor 17 isoform X1 [Callorhinchus milii]|uniref:Pre-mRNA-processing factor 17 n=1 Tax=Callorhinchus milii TaxID=7868 RepID=A0A4W3J3U6_CALMI|nr:pre-mRNA-processing factor 17 isoform X1 [Callorhinchus milii]|eukprot:gi/632953028/ref/XP_007892172.1/ PREDICTED: pre-mRNA-processing factor 17 [Callorhinchus milii]